MQCMKSDVYCFFSTSLQCVINFVSLCLFSFCMFSQELISALKKKKKMTPEQGMSAKRELHASAYKEKIKRNISY